MIRSNICRNVVGLGFLSHGRMPICHNLTITTADDETWHAYLRLAMIWISKTFKFGAEWAADQDRFAAMQMSLAANGTDDYRKVMMVTLDGPERSNIEQVFLRLPEPYRHLFAGYGPVAAPVTVTSLLVGDAAEFEHLFRPNAQSAE